MRVYEEFCKVTKIGPDWCSETLKTTKKHGTGDFDDPNKSSKVMKFGSRPPRK
jgi:hypothetical protein